jgi:hypothetical protein
MVLGILSLAGGNNLKGLCPWWREPYHIGGVWIPACAGMTVGAVCGLSSTFGYIGFVSRRHSLLWQLLSSADIYVIYKELWPP